MLPELALVLIPLLVVVDPPASLGLFLGLTGDRDAKGRRAVALKAGAFAASVLIVFAVGGRVMLQYLGIEIHSLQIAGGLLLVMIGLRMLREGRELPRRELKETHEREAAEARQAEVHLPTGGAHEHGDHDPSFVPLGLPMLAGPGAISLVIVQPTTAGLSVVTASILIVMTITVLALMAAAKAQHLIGDNGTRVITRIMGILTVAFAVQYVLDGIDGWQAAA